MTTTDELRRDTHIVGAGSQLTAENRSIQVDGDSFVYRRFGNEQTDAPPLIGLQHFRGNLDSWDPALVDRLAEDREVILLDNRGVGGSTGDVPDNVTDMARDALAFIDALDLKEVDILGFSLGGYVAQELALLRPRLVRRLVLAGTAPQGGPDLHRWSDTVFALATADQPTAEGLLGLFFSPSDESRARGAEYLQRAYARQEDRDAPTDLATRDAQFAAITAWGIPDASRLNRLAGITQPTLVANGDDDQMMPRRTAACSPNASRTPSSESTPMPITAFSTSTRGNSPTTSWSSSTARGPGPMASVIVNHTFGDAPSNRVKRPAWAELSARSRGCRCRPAECTKLVVTALANRPASDQLEELAEQQAALRRLATRIAAGASPTEVFEAVSAEAAALLAR